MNIFPSAGFVWFFYKYLCNRNPFLLQTEAPQGAAMLVYKGRAEKVWLLVYCIHLPHLPVSPTDSDVTDRDCQTQYGSVHSCRFTPFKC